MCGEIDEPTSYEEELAARFLLNMRDLIAHTPKPPDTLPKGDMNAYLDKLFYDAISRALRDVEGAPEEERYQRLSMQSLVFARIAGILAGHVGLTEDPMRRSLEALMHGYTEGETMEPEDHHHHHHGDEGHGHGHAHGHSHGHSHGHGDHSH
ncbi:MAG: hypothetical protein RLZ98_2711 [Pseudomonadota bacterium]|jgi:hypothetical protein